MAVESKVKVKEKSKKRGLALKTTDLYRGFKAEAKRITWPTKNDIKKASLAVLVLCGIYMVFVLGIDEAFSTLFNKVFGLQ
ncbi:MAG: preprotein translocase subunit SecE [Bacillota bacterium]|nr:preprotein translocase subunit SecE [Bacillota bacterium]